MPNIVSPTATAPPAAPASVRRPTGNGPVSTLVTNLVVDLVLPIGLYYGLRGAGVGPFVALLAGAAVPALGLAVRRHVDSLALFTVTILVLTVAVSFVGGGPRLLLAKDGWLTAVAGIWVLVTLFTDQPFVYQAARPVADARATSPELAWTVRYRASAHFRHGMRVVTAAWGVALVLDAVIRVLMAYTLPVDLVPALSGAQYGVLFTALHLFGHVYGTRQGLIGTRNQAVDAPASADPF